MKKVIGEVGVDSGQILVCDPCYIDSQWKKERFEGNTEEPPKYPFSYNACSKKTCNSYDGQLNFEMGHSGVGVVTSSGYGDGCYPVIADIDDRSGRVKSITIVFIDDDERDDVFDDSEERRDFGNDDDDIPEDEDHGTRDDRIRESYQ
jgi:hypothetical protein